MPRSRSSVGWREELTRRAGRGGRRGLVLAAALLSAACAHRATTPPSELNVLGDPRCPLPLVWPSAEQTPRRVRIRNRTADTLVVDLDRCFRYTTLAPVAPGQVVQANLPARMIAYPDGFRFHAFTGSPRVGSWRVLPVPGLTLELVPTARRA